MATKTNIKIKDIVYRNYELYLDGEFTVKDFKATQHCLIETEYLEERDITYVNIYAKGSTIIKYGDIHYKMQKGEIFRLYKEEDFIDVKFYAFKVHLDIYSLRKVLIAASC